MKFITLLLTAHSLVCLGSAHTIMQSVNGNKQGDGIYMPGDDSFIWDVTSDSMACNGAPVTQFRSSNIVVPVKAGEEVTGAWLHTLSSTGPDQYADNKVIDSSHKGPVTAWLKKVDDATKNPSSGPGPGWFKITEAGLANGKWAVDDLIAAGGIQRARIPTCIADGDYLLRLEILALHSASVLGQNQFYIECAQIRVSGGTGTAKPATVSIPGVYRQDDAGIKVNIWNNFGKPYPDSYAIPGPRPFTCPANSVPSIDSTPPTTTLRTLIASVTTPAITSAVRPTTTAATVSTTSTPLACQPEAESPQTTKPSGSSVALYGQCGGVSYSGATTCAQGTCKKTNKWYSQCLL